MAKKLYFRYGCMNSGKSTILQQVAFNYQERGMRAVVVKPSTDTKAPTILSRLGVACEVDWSVEPDESLLARLDLDEKAGNEKPACIIVDEAQFLTRRQVDELLEIAVCHDVPVIAYGLRTDFRTDSFPGARRLLEVAHTLEELKTICRCGRKALFNARLVGGEFVREGSSVAIDGQGVEYESLCPRCYLDKVGDFPEE